MEELPSFCSTRSWTSYGYQIRTLKTALRPLGKKKQWQCCYMETVPFFTPRGKLILNNGAMPRISRLKSLSVCVNVVSKNTKLIWQNLNSAETEKRIGQRKTDLKTSINNKSRQKHVTLLYTYGHPSVCTPYCLLLRFVGSCCAKFETGQTFI